MLRLLLVRHGETTWNVQQRFQGHSDVPLSEVGRAQARALAATLRSRTIDAVYASDLCRATETAEILMKERALPITQTEALRELAFGRWEGLTYDEIQDTHRDELSAWLADRLHVAPPGGESLAQLEARVRTIFGELRRDHAEQTVLIVSHGGPLQLLLATEFGLPPESFWQFCIDPCSLTELDLYPAGAILLRLNLVSQG
jgi:alpha-ribazole phosphatase/probable phosphoglycerate mutase